MKNVLFRLYGLRHLVILADKMLLVFVFSHFFQGFFLCKHLLAFVFVMQGS
jgi:hypothetical protein